MHKNKTTIKPIAFTPHSVGVEPLEGRRLLSAAAFTGGHLANIRQTAEPVGGATVVPFAHRTAPSVVTTAALGISTNASVLGQPVTLTAKIGATSGTPTGVVDFLVGRHTVLGSANIASRGRASIVVYNLYKGNYSNIRAVYEGTSTFISSTSPNVSLVTTQGSTTTAGDGLQTATVVAGTGPGITTLQNATLNYTGYLDNGTKFDSSLNPGRTPFAFQVAHIRSLPALMKACWA